MVHMLSSYLAWKMYVRLHEEEDWFFWIFTFLILFIAEFLFSLLFYIQEAYQERYSKKKDVVVMNLCNKLWFLFVFLLFDCMIFTIMYGFGDWKKLMQVLFRNISQCDFFPVLIRQNRFYWVINWYIYEGVILVVYWKWPKIYDYSTLKHFDGQSFYIPKGIAR